MAYEENVFINCPFDGSYHRLFQALVFAVHDCGFVARCALELDDGSEARIEKIRRIIAESKYGIHDISRTEPDEESDLPRFNMPLELGLFLGAKQFGGPRHRAKACLIFDRERYRYQRFCSDIAGLDVRAHQADEREVIRGVRDALRSWQPGREIPGARVMFDRYLGFREILPQISRRMRVDDDELTFSDLTTAISEWLKIQALAREAALDR